MDVLDAELENLRTALSWSLDRGDHESAQSVAEEWTKEPAAHEAESESWTSAGTIESKTMSRTSASSARAEARLEGSGHGIRSKR